MVLITTITIATMPRQAGTLQVVSSDHSACVSTPKHAHPDSTHTDSTRTDSTHTLTRTP